MRAETAQVEADAMGDPFRRGVRSRLADAVHRAAQGRLGRAAARGGTEDRRRVGGSVGHTNAD